MTEVAALYIDPRGPYPALLRADACWDEQRDARATICGNDVTHEAEVDVLRRMANNYLVAFEQVDCELRASRQETPQHTHCPVCDRPIYNGKHPDLPCVPGRQIGDVWIPAKPDVRVLSVHGNDKVTGRDYRAAY